MMTLRYGAVLAVMMLGTTAQAQDAPPPLPVVKDLPVSAGYEGRVPDVLGIQFGEDKEVAKAMLATAYPGAVVNETVYEGGAKDNRGNVVRFLYDFGYVVAASGPPKEQVILRFTTGSTGARVYEIERSVTYDRGSQASMQELKDAIFAKYGEPTLIELYPHQNRDEITYTWEKREAPRFGTQDVSKRSFRDRGPHQSDVCLLVPGSSAYMSSNSNTYRVFSPGSRKGNPGWFDTCIGAIKFSIFYGSNDQTVSGLRVVATDYNRSMEDARTTDALLAQMLEAAAGSVQVDGAPKL